MSRESQQSQGSQNPFEGDDRLSTPIRGFTDKEVVQEIRKSIKNPDLIRKVQKNPNVLKRLRSSPNEFIQMRENPKELEQWLYQMIDDKEK